MLPLCGRVTACWTTLGKDPLPLFPLFVSPEAVRRRFSAHRVQVDQFSGGLGLFKLVGGQTFRRGEPVSEGTLLVPLYGNADGHMVGSSRRVRLRRGRAQTGGGDEPVQIASDLLRWRLGVFDVPFSVPHG